MKKLLLSTLLAALLCASFTAVSYAAIERDADGFYKISTSDDLKEFTELVNSGYLIANAKLMNDIVLSSDQNPCDWTAVGPIGPNANREYLGILDGGVCH